MSAASLVRRVLRPRNPLGSLPAHLPLPTRAEPIWGTTRRRTASTATGPDAKSRRLLLSITGTALLSTALGFAMAAVPAAEDIKALIHPPSNEETANMFIPLDDDAQEKESFINAHPLVAELRANPDFNELRMHMKMPPAWRRANLTGGTLQGSGRMAVPPISWSEKDGKSLVQIFHAGKNLCGHAGIVHGGFLATMLDEGLALCCFPVLPHNIGMTAKLEINYKAPAKADQYMVLRATTTNVEGRKAWVEGQIETLPTNPGEQPVVLATASALYISPKQAGMMAKIYQFK